MIALGQHSDRSATFLIERESAVDPKRFAEFLPRSTVRAFLAENPTFATFAAQGVMFSCLSNDGSSFFFHEGHFIFDGDATYSFRIALAHSSW